MKVTRRGLLVGSLSGLAVLGANTVWKKRFFFRIFHRPMGGPRPPLSRLELLPSAVGTLSDPEKETLWQLLGAFGQTWDMDVGDRASFFSLLDLKTEQAPSYLAEYRNGAARFTELRRTQPPSLAAKGMLQPHDGDDSGQHARDFVAREYISLLLMSGGFRKFGLGKYPGFAGGQGGYRLSKHGGRASG